MYFKEPTKVTYFDQKHYHKQDFRTELESKDLSPVLQCNNPNLAFDTLMALFIPVSQKHIPVKTAKIPSKNNHKARKQWIDTSLKKRIKKQHKLYEQVQKHPADTNIAKEHRTYKNKLRKDITKAKKNYYSALFDKHLKNAKKT
eukprot:Lithocolla_globosa_v1_NODE_1696_length_2395_cov_24.624359.p2 type:complete len:144 gc:universal NODE_1696_length_2395_cov_24.624359:444-875(+)